MAIERVDHLIARAIRTVTAPSGQRRFSSPKPPRRQSA